jgi:hypothetical protein
MLYYFSIALTKEVTKFYGNAHTFSLSSVFLLMEQLPSVPMVCPEIIKLFIYYLNLMNERSHRPMFNCPPPTWIRITTARYNQHEEWNSEQSNVSD